MEPLHDLVVGQWVIEGICPEIKDIYLVVCLDNKRKCRHTPRHHRAAHQQRLHCHHQLLTCLWPTGLGRLAATNRQPSNHQYNFIVKNIELLVVHY